MASLLWAKYPRLAPQEVKNRIIYCSDDVAHFRGKLFGGKLNARCVLEGDAGTLRGKTDAAGAKPRLGQFQAGSMFNFRNHLSGREVSLAAESIRSIEYDTVSDSYVVFYNEDSSELNSRLLKEDDLVFVDGTSVVPFIEKDVGAKPITVSEISRYVSAVKS